MANAHIDHHLALLNHLRTILVALGEAEQILDDSHAMFIERYDELLADLPNAPDSSLYLGQDLISQIFQRYPQIAHLIPRDLLWFFGGDCLHYMPDEEIAMYQLLDERRFQAEEDGEPFDWNQEKQLLAMPTQGGTH
ncbi:PA2817 family protein [Pseudomonas xionganensis]|uniref:Dehydrogenase n=1 Tax=Pseudomonas xionganensis TaxID=2654845 RepID=A0A6I4KZE7_9PSED|nr:PA2817 family protein [Pseudomonas xionganensis]MVW77111.1 dehydrogenase [Pseudomonas xionganensis]